MTLPFPIRRPRLVLLIGVAAALAAGVGIPRVRFETDLRSLIGDHSPAAEMFFDLQDYGAANETLFLTVAGDGEEGLERALEHARVLRDGLSMKAEVKSVESGPSAEAISRFRDYVTENLFLLLPPEDLRLALARLSGEGLAKASAEARALLESAAPLATRELLLADPFSLRELISLPGTDRIPRYRDGMLISDDGSAVLLVLTAHAPPTDGEEVRRFLGAVRGVVSELAGSRPDGVDVDLAGGYLFAEAAESRVRGDLLRTMIPSILAVVLLFWLFFRSLSGLLIVGAPVALALIVTMGTVGWLGVRITPVTAAFGALLVGLGVDFGIHLLVSIHVESRDGRKPPDAVARALRGVRRGILLGGITTAGAVATLALADLPGLASLGLLLAIGVLVAMAGALTLSVALAVILSGRTTGLGGEPFAALGGWLDARRGAVRVAVAVLAVVLIGTLVLAGPPGLSSDPGDLRPVDDPPTLAVRRLMDRFPNLSLSDLVAWRGTDLDAGLAALAEAREHLAARDLVRDWSGPGLLLPPADRQRRSLELLAAFDAEGFASRAGAALREEGINPEPFRPAIEGLEKALSVDAPLPASELASPALRPVARRFLVATGEDHILVAYYRSSGATSAAVRQVLEAQELPVIATGPRSLLEGITSRVETEFRLIPALVLLTVLVATLAGFRSLRQSLLSMTPVLLGMAFTLSVMTFSGMSFNIINIGLIPMVLGLGVDDGIQFVNRLRREGDRPLSATYRHVGGAILLTTLTTCAAFGSLAISTSPGLSSMGYLVSLGALSCCGATLLALPAVLPGRRDDG